MCITAHPDDEAGSFGGSLRIYADRGVETSVVCLTPGQAGSHRGGAANDQELAELRKKESDRIRAVATNLQRLGAQVQEFPDGLLIPGNQTLRGGTDSFRTCRRDVPRR